jgi:HK97 family phage major capsid protein
MRSPIIALRQRKHDLAAKAERLNSLGELNETQEAEFATLLAGLKTTEAALIVEEQRLEADRAMPGQGDDNSMFARRAGAHNPAAGSRGSGGGERLFKPGQPGAKYADLFGPNLSPGGFQSFSEFLQAFHNAPHQYDPRLRAAQQEDIPSTGGFAVPTEYAAFLLDKALENEIVRPRAQQWPMSSETRKIPALDNFNHSSSLFGGFTAQWTAETGTITPQDLKTRLITLTANKLALLGNASNELLADAVNGFEAVYGAAMIAAVSWFHDYAFLQGDGAGKPLGVLNDPALIVVAKETQDPDTIIFTNVAKMFARLHPACFNSSVWVVNSTALPQMLAMTFTSLSALDGLRAPAVVQADDGSFRLFTRPVLVTEKLPALGSQGDILLADFSQYAIGLRQGAALEKSIHPGFTNDTTYFRIITRLDGQGTWKSAVTPKVGDSLSWCVTLAARTS